MSDTPVKPTALIVLDGWGYREENRDNAIANGNTPVWDRLWAQAPHTLISSSGLDVGLPEGQMGNSEVGHMSLGSGRVIYQNITRIDQAIKDGSFDTNPAFCAAVDKAIAAGGAVHLFGLLSPGGVHSHENQIFAAIRLAKKCGAQRIYLHAFLDGRDTPPRSAGASLAKADALFADMGSGRVASICGRYYAMDRDNRWERVKLAYDAMVNGQGTNSENITESIAKSYIEGVTDEFILPIIHTENDAPIATIQNGDVVLCFNFRTDRGREITQALTQKDFPEQAEKDDGLSPI